MWALLVIYYCCSWLEFNLRLGPCCCRCSLISTNGCGGGSYGSCGGGSINLIQIMVSPESAITLRGLLVAQLSIKISLVNSFLLDRKKIFSLLTILVDLIGFDLIALTSGNKLQVAMLPKYFCSIGVKIMISCLCDVMSACIVCKCLRAREYPGANDKI